MISRNFIMFVPPYLVAFTLAATGFFLVCVCHARICNRQSGWALIKGGHKATMRHYVDTASLHRHPLTSVQFDASNSISFKSKGSRLLRKPSSSYPGL